MAHHRNSGVTDKLYSSTCCKRSRPLCCDGDQGATFIHARMDNGILPDRGHSASLVPRGMICTSSAQNSLVDVWKWQFTLKHDVITTSRPPRLIKDNQSIPSIRTRSIIPTGRMHILAQSAFHPSTLRTSIFTPIDPSPLSRSRFTT